MRLPPGVQPLRAHRPVHIHAQLATIDHQHIACIQHCAVFAQCTEVVAEQLRGIHLTQPLHAIKHFARQLADDCKRRKDL